MADTQQTIRDLELRLARCEAQRETLERVVQMLTGSAPPPKESPPAEPPADLTRAILTMTPKQAQALQMLLRGASNREIARRFNVSESAAKTTVRTIMQKLHVSTRAEVVIVAKPIFDAIEPHEYERVIGLSKTWDADAEDKGKRPEAPDHGDLPGRSGS